MKLSHFFSRKKIGEPARKEQILAEARELAHLRLEQCITDLHNRIHTSTDSLGPHSRSASDGIPKVA